MLGCGIGKIVVIDLIEKLYQKDPFIFSTIHVHIVKENIASISLFSSLGFKESGQLNWSGFINKNL